MGLGIKFVQRGDLKRTTKFLEAITDGKYLDVVLSQYGQRGVDALAANTPKDSGLTAQSWYYEIKQTNEGFSITWKNSNVNKGVPIAIILQYGHGTRNGGYVVGRDYINPAIQPIFDEIADKVWREVERL